jgi:DNA-binding MarR family transcriptional regulator
VTPAGELRFLILGAQREGNRRLAALLAPEGLTPAQAEVLSVLSGSGPMTLTDLGRRLVCEAGSPSRLVDVLVRAGLIDRVASEQDRRRVELSLTPAGAAKARVVAAVDAELDRQLGALDEQALRGAADALRLLLDGTNAGEAVRLRGGLTPPPARPSSV